MNFHNMFPILDNSSIGFCKVWQLDVSTTKLKGITSLYSPDDASIVGKKYVYCLCCET